MIKKIVAIITIILLFATITGIGIPTQPTQPAEKKIQKAVKDPFCDLLKPDSFKNDFPYFLSCEELYKLQESNRKHKEEKELESGNITAKIEEVIVEVEPVEETIKEPVATIQIPMTAEYYVTSHFGERCDVAGVYTGCFFHTGIDFGNNQIIGQELKPVMAGEVIDTYFGGGPFPCGGNYIVIKNPETNLFFLYAHLNDFYVLEGQHVGLDATVGTVGTTGCSNGPHLHLEIMEGAVGQNYLNPYDWFKENNINI